MRTREAHQKEMKLGYMEDHVDVGDYTVHYIGAGEGPPMLLLHGEGMSCNTWLQNIEPLSRFFSLYAPDLLSVKEASSFCFRLPDLEHAAEIIYRFMSRLEIERAHLVGFSSGTAIADLFSIRHPERVHRLVFIAGLGLRRTSPTATGDNQDVIELQDAERESLLRRPVLIITGESDPTIRCESVCYIVARNPLAKWVIIPEGQHRIHEEHPEEVNRQIISYCIETPVNQFCG